ncbi:MAG: PHP domain-containing protein [Candidatus Tectomicrobia bacterium]|nr:PHP domain-containing protein [Candidatus Tectomicrobia bacterium]
MASIVDLHMHSYYSDGSFSPRALVARGAVLGLRYLAITDHDEVQALPEARAAGAEHGVAIIPGIEISTRYDNLGLHILGYCFDADHPAMRALVAQQARSRNERAEQIVAKFTDLGFGLDFDAIAAHARGALSQPLIVHALLASERNRQLLRRRGHEATHETLYRHYLSRGGPAYVPKFSPDSREAIDLLHTCGGVAVLAHPSVDLWPDRHDLLNDLAEAGLDGLEVYSSNHSEEMTAVYVRCAREYGLLMTGGSDFHGEAVPEFDLGSGCKGNLDMGVEIVEDLYQRHADFLAGRAAG